MKMPLTMQRLSGSTFAVQAIVSGLDFPASATLVRRHCRVGARVTLLRDLESPDDPNAIAVWLHYRTLGIVGKLAQIGYVKATQAALIAPQLDAGAMTIDSACVRSLYVADKHNLPRISIQIMMRENATRTRPGAATPIR